MSPKTLDQASQLIEQQHKELVQLRARCEHLESKLLHLAPDAISRDEPRQAHREFLARDSVLGSHDQDSNAIIRVISLATVSLVLVDILRDPHGIVLEKLFSLLVWGFRPLPMVAMVWLGLSLIGLLVVPLFVLWSTSRISSRAHSIAYFAVQTLLWLVASVATASLHLPPSCSIIIMAEAARYSMKMHAFTIETRRYALEPPGTKKHQELHLNLIADEIKLLKHYVYFLFAPTLVYRNSYPKSARTNWTKVFGYAVHTFIGIVVTGYIFCSSFLQEPIWKSWSAILIQILSAMIPGMALMLLAFFVILHSWFNAFAEILRFADRQFYLRWWTARSYSSYYRRWNKVVGDWIHAYIYMDLQNYGFGPGRAAVVSILISAVVHEYIIMMTLGFFYPVLFVLFAGFGLVFMFANKLIKKQSDGWNWFLWSTLFFGNGILLSLYSTEYIARTNHVRMQYPIDKTSWLPFSWQIFFSRVE